MNALHNALLQHPHTLSSLSKHLSEPEESIKKKLSLLLEMKKVKQKRFKTSCKREAVRIFYTKHGSLSIEEKRLKTPSSYHLQSNCPAPENSGFYSPPNSLDNMRGNTDSTVESTSLVTSQTSKTTIAVIRTSEKPQNEHAKNLNIQNQVKQNSSIARKPKHEGAISHENIISEKNRRKRKFVLPRFTNTEHKAPALHTRKIRKTINAKRFKPPRLHPKKKQSKEKVKSRNNDSDPIQLKTLIKKWTEACQDALTALVKEVPERNLTLKQLIDKFGIPPEKVLYDTESEEFGNVSASLDKLLVLRSDS